MTADFPTWLAAVATASLAVGIACAAVVAVDVRRRPQPMSVMNLVFPIVMLFGSVPWLIFYWQKRRAPLRGADRGEHGDSDAPRWVSIATSTSHCGAGCALGDLISEFTVAAVPALAVAVGWGSLYEKEIFAAWIWDFVLAFGIGIAFQYFAIAPMRQQSWRRSLVDALKADAASIAAWQVGMYGLMALIQLVLFTRLFGGTASVFSVEFWFAMQFAMVAGFACSFPINTLLIRHGVKEAM